MKAHDIKKFVEVEHGLVFVCIGSIVPYMKVLGEPQYRGEELNAVDMEDFGLAHIADSEPVLVLGPPQLPTQEE